MTIETDEARTYAAIAKALAASYRSRPTDGTDREQQAWENGFFEAAAEIVEELADGTSDLMAAIFDADSSIFIEIRDRVCH